MMIQSVKQYISTKALEGSWVYGAFIHANALRLAIPRYCTPSVVWGVAPVKRLVKLSQTASNRPLVRAAIQEQLARVLKDALAYVPYYRDSVQIRPTEISPQNAFEALSQFPYLQKATVMENAAAFVDQRARKGRLIYGTSGGSTGRGIGVWRTWAERQIERFFFCRHWGRLGYNDTSRIVRMGTEARKASDQDPCVVSGNRLMISPYHFNAKWIERIYTAICAFRPDAFHAYPSCLEHLARYMVREGKPALECRGVLLASEACSTEQCALFTRCFTGKISVNYGLSEGAALAFAEYDAQKGLSHYKIDELYAFVENRPLPDGLLEIVGTSYWYRTMPFIRYRTEDIGPVENGVIRTLDGRTQEHLITKQGEIIPGFTIKIDEFTWNYVDVLQVVQNRPGHIVFRIVPKSNYSAAVGRDILNKQKERWGQYFDMELDVVREILRTTAGKHRLIINELRRHDPPGV